MMAKLVRPAAEAAGKGGEHFVDVNRRTRGTVNGGCPSQMDQKASEGRAAAGRERSAVTSQDL